jgi:putative ABC transport system permease protein
VLLIAVAAVISVPLIYLGATRWLSEYPVRVGLTTLYFIAPVGAVFFLVVTTAGLHAMRAANANPVDHLKNE